MSELTWKRQDPRLALLPEDIAEGLRNPRSAQTAFDTVVNIQRAIGRSNEGPRRNALNWALPQAMQVLEQQKAIHQQNVGEYGDFGSFGEDIARSAADFGPKFAKGAAISGPAAVMDLAAWQQTPAPAVNVATQDLANLLAIPGEVPSGDALRSNVGANNLPGMMGEVIGDPFAAVGGLAKFGKLSGAALAAAMGYQKAATMAGGVTPDAARMLAAQRGGAFFAGTPVRNLVGNRFDLRFVGTGEGETRRGYGIYLAERRDIANRYRGDNGSVFEADIDDELIRDNFVGLETAMYKQPSAVKTAFEDATYPQLRQSGNLFEFTEGSGEKIFRADELADKTGEQAYNLLGMRLAAKSGIPSARTTGEALSANELLNAQPELWYRVSPDSKSRMQILATNYLKDNGIRGAWFPDHGFIPRGPIGQLVETLQGKKNLVLYDPDVPSSIVNADTAETVYRRK